MSDNDTNNSNTATPEPFVVTNTATNSENMVTTLLKSPQKVSDRIAAGIDLLKSAGIFLVAALLCHAVFGLAVGLFGGQTVALMDIVKFPLVALFSLLLCFPSLYVFSCVSGTPLSLAQTAVVACSCLAMLGLILVGLAPVAWLFAVSTKSIAFVVVLTLVIWGTALGFVVRYTESLKANPLFQQQAGIKLWFIIFCLVSLQMATCMRPMLTKPAHGWWTSEKKSFVVHFNSVFE